MGIKGLFTFFYHYNIFKISVRIYFKKYRFRTNIFLKKNWKKFFVYVGDTCQSWYHVYKLLITVCITYKFLFSPLCAAWNRSVKRETLKLIETFLDKAEDQPQIGKQFVPPMMDPVLGDYARNVPDARESEVLSLFATIINKYYIFFSLCSL